MPSNVTISLYVGSGAEGQKMYEKIERECIRRGTPEKPMSISEYIMSLIRKDLK